MDPMEASASRSKHQEEPLKEQIVEKSVREDIRVDEDEDEEEDDKELGRRLTAEERAQYLQQLEDSEGFDIGYFPGVYEMGMISPVLNFKKDPLWYNCSRQWSILAIEDYNKKNNTDYEFDDVEKVNVLGCRGFECWVTFRAKDAADPCSKVESKIFQAKVYAGINEVDVEKCQLKKEF